MDPERIKAMKKIGIEMCFLMGITLSFFLSLVGTLSGGHFTVPSWLLSFLISLVISLIIGFIVPMKPVLDKADAKAGLKPGTLPARFLESLISDLIYTPLISLCMVSFAYLQLKQVASMVPDMVLPPFLPMFLKSLVLTMAAGYVLIFIFQPLFMKWTMKRHGISNGKR